MEICISFEGNITGEKSYELMGLANLLENDGSFSITRQGQPHQGVKTELTEVLTIANFTLAAIGTLLSILNHWRSSRPKLSMTLQFNGKSIVIDNITSPNQMHQLISQIERTEITSPKIIISGA